jgi:hypothetical protein
VVVVVTVAVALLSFAATAWDVAAQARHRVAEDRLGAQRVLTVSAEQPGALSDAVAKADPGGHSMAVVRTSQRYGDASVELLGVQADRLADVAIWRGRSHEDLVRLAQRLHPPAAAPLTVGRELWVQASATGLPQVELRLAAVVSMPGQPPRTVGLGTLTKGTHEYHAGLPGCGDCRLVGLSLGRAAGGSDPIAARLTVHGIRSGTGAVPAGFDKTGTWKAHSAGSTVTPGGSLQWAVQSSEPADAVVDYVDTPAALPAVLAGQAPADDAAATSFGFPGFAEQPQPFTVVDRAAELPRAGGRGLLFDLDYATRMAERTSSLADDATLRYEVWAGPSAPADLEHRLAEQGVPVVRVETVGAYLDQLARRAPALGLWLYLLAGAAALLLAVGVVLLTAYVGVQGRLYELAALRATGVRAGVLRRAVFREYRALLGVPFVVGLAAGVAGALVMLPGIPLVTVDEPTGSLRYTMGSGVLLPAVGISLAGLLIAVLMVLRMLRRADPARLLGGGGA